MPIQGLIENHMLAVRPCIQGKGAALCLLEHSEDESTKALLATPGIKRYPPGKGIAAQWCRDRDQIVLQWPGGQAPVPDWTQYREGWEDPAREQPEPDELELEIGLGELSLTDQQKAMLLPVEARIQNLVYPASIKARVTAAATKSFKRRSRWASKLHGHFRGKAQARWVQRVKDQGLEKAIQKIKEQQGPTVMIKKTLAPSKKSRGVAKFRPRPKRKAQGDAKAKDAPVDAKAEAAPVDAEIDDHPLLKKDIRVVNEAAGTTLIGRAGQVVRAFEVTEASGAKWTRLAVSEALAGGKAKHFFANSEHVQETALDGQVEPMGALLDFRKLKGDLLAETIQTLDLDKHPENLEAPEHGQCLEHSSVRAGLLELELRFQDVECKLVPPQVALALSNYASEQDLGGETEAFHKQLASSKHVILVVWSEPPAHYTYLELYEDANGGPEGYRVTYKDSLEKPSQEGLQRAARILKTLGFRESAESLRPSSAPQGYQRDGWSCGLWVLKWIETRLREVRGEPRLPDPSIEESLKKVGTFIAKLKRKAQPQPKAKSAPKAKAKPRAKPKLAEHETLEEALQAGLRCTKCVATTKGTKGCRACVGEWFEGIRLRATPDCFLKRMGIQVPGDED